MDGHICGLVGGRMEKKMKQILLLEDDENLNRGISLKLGREGYQVFSAYTIGEAEVIFESEQIDLVISDITLPDGNGLDFGKRVRQQSDALLIYLTAMDQEIDIVNGYDTGALLNLSKTELQLLLFLLENAGHILSKESILEQVWGLDGQFVDDNTVTVNISRLKNKLGTDAIENVRGLGYIWTEKVNQR